jgi:myo-inositol-1(or 4)-monophosphatase
VAGPDPRELLEIALAVALDAGAVVQRRASDVRVAVATKSSPTDMVSEVDRETEELIASRILAARPADGILGEEGGARPGTSGYRWVVDPLDGTTNYLYGYPAYAVSIGVEHEGIGLAGVVFDAVQSGVYAAARGHGATLDGAPIAVSEKRDIATALLGTGFGYTPARRAAQAGILAFVLPRVRDVRRSGSAALDLCAVACGRLDGFFEFGLQPWDYSAAAVIIREAGGRIGRAPAAPGHPAAIVAGPPGLYRPLRALLREARASFAAPK